jgi:SAM-dependent methyltransferase
MRRQFRGQRFGRGLEIGCGTGLLTIALADSCDQTIGVDINRRAVACAKINQRINDVGNLDIRLSDVFTEVPETFDVVIGNVPFNFVPPAERDSSLHSYGGEDYGVDFQLRCLAELDRKLNDGGTALFLCCSPVVKGVDILPDRMRARFEKLRLQFHFLPLFNNSVPQFMEFHDSVGIQYTWAYVVTVRKGGAFKLTMQPPTAWTVLVSWAYRTVVRAAHRMGRV